MAWTQKLVNVFDRPDCSKVLAQFQGDTRRSQRVSILMGNPAVGKNSAIANHIADICEVLCFERGHKFIEQGNNGDDVFFLLSGEANIILNGQKITYRESPTQVGEMAARAPGKLRTATVAARSKVIAVGKISGEQFRNIEETHPDFRDRLTVELEARYRERLNAQEVYAENTAVVWTLISIAAAILLGLTVWKFAVPDSWSTASQALLSIAAAFLGFLLTLTRNPVFLWRNGAYFIAIATVGYVLLGRQIRLKAEGGPFETASFELVSDGGEESWQLLLIKIGAMIILCAIFAFMDRLRTKG